MAKRIAIDNSQNGGTDAYFTPRMVAEQLFCEALKHAPANARWIEPSAGAGVFCDVMQSHGIKPIAMDIEPMARNIRKKNFLDYRLPKNSVVIGNPPFGYCGSSALEFMRHASTAQVIAFILPASFQKASMQNKVPLNFTLAWQQAEVIDFELPNHGIKRVPCVLQVWTRLPEGQTRQKITPDLGKDLGIHWLQSDVTVIEVRPFGHKTRLEAFSHDKYSYRMLAPSHILEALQTPLYQQYANAYASMVSGQKSLSRSEIVQALRQTLAHS